MPRLPFQLLPHAVGPPARAGAGMYPAWSPRDGERTRHAGSESLSLSAVLSAGLKPAIQQTGSLRYLAQRWVVPKSVCRLALSVLLMVATAQAAPEAGPPVPEYQLKAAVLVNLAKFVEWPTNAFASATAPLVIGVVGQDPFGRWLDQAAQGQTVAGHPVQVQRLSATERVPAAQVLFISRSEQGQVPKVLEAAQGGARLTVSDVEGFAAQGGMVGLVLREGMVRFEVNLAALESAGLRLSSKVLKYATLVGPRLARPEKS